MKIGIIGGTGVYALEYIENPLEVNVATPFGIVTPSVGVYEGMEVAFLPRHGSAHSIPPHKVNYRANIYGLTKWGAKYVFSTAASGSLKKDFGPGHLVVLSDFLDFTKGRTSTFYEGGSDGVVHIDVTEPYCPVLRKIVYLSGMELKLPIHSSGIYACFEGPRFETPAEIRACQVLGAELVGMTNVPEVVLAREAGLHYTTIAISTNYAAGISSIPLSHEEVLEVMKTAGDAVTNLIFTSIKKVKMIKEICGCEEPKRKLPGL
ncbi:MAG: S-methyl-5'-thioinosine phosphorylase [candidate division WS2 bacterium]|uniref:Probable 6-oxopurine nucleoside phosphorylase n=1 Tax=Psychracetigena formicireducens TaxID=2986056 RepID=A0A9E2BFS1_PSYF1|nr:S-methyl-5'-thioinosine phosphorylase [Candidatus Psychracetigena formicireducens]MBT9144796.1 S-methyl-5'-thioinosine phosphorylase [Candidatus Psychracetigena formicireducens]MBT9149939.1 S-methyl-5'-thioinosine phosphorylase [Candidatus Psychracetigena formicireducens]